MTKHITVIVVNYNSGARLQKCMAALSAQTYRDFDVLVVDNNSGDQSLDFAMPENLDVRFIRLPENVGFAAANNRAAEITSAEWLAFLNPDAYAQDDWLQSFVNGAARYLDVDAFGSLQLNAADPSLIDGAGDVYFAAGISYRGGFSHPVETAPVEGECFAPCAAAAFYRRQVFDRLGGFEESFFCYSEDVDLAFRLRLAGGRVVQLRDAVVHHEGSGITGQLSGFAIYHGHRNRLWTYFRNMPVSLLFITLPAQLVMSFLLIFYFVFKGSGGPYLKAMRDAITGLPQALKDRRRIQATRRASIGSIAKAMVWSPIRFLKREPHSQH
ncbi:MAG: glycosyltransferase family 2 protein [Alphaproteobacteria bacterium]|nr:glycosyltransferase family 2 protein [Alphaproteobacteria bacterium]